MSDATLSSFQNELDRRIKASNAGLDFGNVWKVGEWFLGVIRSALENSDLSGLTQEQFLQIIDTAYDKYVKPIDLPGPDIVLDPMLKAFCLRMAENLWDKVRPVPTMMNTASLKELL